MILEREAWIRQDEQVRDRPVFPCLLGRFQVMPAIPVERAVNHSAAMEVREASVAFVRQGVDWGTPCGSTILRKPANTNGSRALI